MEHNVKDGARGGDGWTEAAGERKRQDD